MNRLLISRSFSRHAHYGVMHTSAQHEAWLSRLLIASFASESATISAMAFKPTTAIDARGDNKCGLIKITSSRIVTPANFEFRSLASLVNHFTKAYTNFIRDTLSVVKFVSKTILAQGQNALFSYFLSLSASERREKRLALNLGIEMPHFSLPARTALDCRRSPLSESLHFRSSFEDALVILTQFH
jgi:hypothetical protein